MMATFEPVPVDFKMFTTRRLPQRSFKLLCLFLLVNRKWWTLPYDHFKILYTKKKNLLTPTLSTNQAFLYFKTDIAHW